MKYYLIPVVDSEILCDGDSLREIFNDNFPVLAKRESERVDIIYSARIDTPIPEAKLNAHTKKTSQMYAIENVPTYLVATGDDDFRAREIVTGKWLVAKYPAALGIREVSKESAEKYFNTHDYFNRVTNYFSYINEGILKSANLEDEPFVEVYEGTAYLNGELDGQQISGKFTGTLKLTKKNRIK